MIIITIIFIIIIFITIIIVIIVIIIIIIIIIIVTSIVTIMVQGKPCTAHLSPRTIALRCGGACIQFHVAIHVVCS